MKLTRHWTVAVRVTLLLGGCGGNVVPIPPASGGAGGREVPSNPVAVRVAPRGETVPVEVGGIAPNDTVVTLRRGEARMVILRHGPPDRAEFLELTLPASVFAGSEKDSITVTVQTRPGVFGVDLSADAKWGVGARLAFKYAVHFYPPDDALRRYGSLTEVDRRLTIARRETNGDLTIYLSSHPAPDVLHAFIPGAGSYVMVVGK